MENTLTDEQIETLLSLHEAGTLKRAERASVPGLRTFYRLTTSMGRYTLCVHEEKPFWDLVHEKDLLLFLSEREAELDGVHVPRLVPNVARGYYFPIGERYACLFEEVDGRALGVFEIDEEVCGQVGMWLARFHNVARRFHGHKRHSHRASVIGRWIRLFEPASVELKGTLALLGEELKGLARVLGRMLPHGTLHGTLLVDAVRLQHGRVAAVTDFHASSRGPLIDDIAVALNAFGWDRDAFSAHRCTALVRAYRALRPLSSDEVRLLHAHARFAALRICAAHIRDFEVHQRAGDAKGYREYTHYRRRLEALRAMRTREFGAICGLGGAA